MVNKPQEVDGFGEAIHRGASAGAGEASGDGGPSEGDDVVDAEFEDLDEPRRQQGR